MASWTSALFVALLCATTAFAEPQWQVITNNFMDICIGVAGLEDGTLYVAGGKNGVGAQIMRSSDTGLNWEALPIGFEMFFMDIDVTEARNGISSGLGMFHVMSGLEFTTDGDAFASTTDTFLATAFQNVEAGLNSSSLYAVGLWQQGLTDLAYNGVISSSDNGATLNYHGWGSDIQARYGSFPSDQVWYVTGGYWPYESVKNAKGIEKRFDANGFMFSERVRLSVGKGRSQQKIVERTERTAESGYYGVISKTEDGGQTFKVVFETEAFYFNGISCASETHCVAVGEGDAAGFIMTTTDGGATWQETLADPGMGLLQTMFRNETEVWAVGGGSSRGTLFSKFYHSVDGGLTWDTESHVIEGVYANAVDVLADGRAYATAFLANGLSAVLGYF